MSDEFQNNSNYPTDSVPASAPDAGGDSGAQDAAPTTPIAPAVPAASEPPATPVEPSDAPQPAAQPAASSAPTTPIAPVDSAAQSASPAAQASQPVASAAQPAAQPAPAADSAYRPAPGYGAYAPGHEASPSSSSYYGSSYNSGSTGQYSSGTPSSGGGWSGQNQYQYANQSAPGAGAQPPYNGNGGANGGANGAPGTGGAPGAGGAGGVQAPAAKKGPSPILTAVIAAIVAIALSLGVSFAALKNGWVSVPSSTTTTTTLTNQTGSTTGSSVQVADGSDWVTVAKAVNSSVVSILVTSSSSSARGSGAILDTDGHVVTNNHVVSGASEIYVTLADGSMYDASIVGTDPTTDLAVIKIDNVPSGLTPITFADSDNLAVGESVMAIGNPLGLSNTTTTGIISALNRPVATSGDGSSSSTSVVTNAIQIDAAINPGNSGGPTFNTAGQVIGINSSIATTSTSSDSGGSIGIGFAIPSNLVEDVCSQIINSGSATHVQLGVSISSQYAEYQNGYRAGAQVESVVSGSPADKAGIQAGDLIVAYNGNAVNSTSSVLGYVRATDLGDTVTLTVLRDGQMLDVTVTMDQAEQSSSSSSSGSNSNGSGNGSGNGGGFYDPFGLFGGGNGSH